MIRPNYSDMPQDKTIYFLASGGRDSTAMVLEAWKVGLQGTLILGDTGVNRPNSLMTLNRLSSITGYPLIKVKYEGDKRPIEILKESFRNIPLALELLEKDKTYKNAFPCCSILKKKPMNKFLNDCNPDNSILVLGIKAGDRALHRRYRMNQLRTLGTFQRRHVKTGLLYYYPLRDCQESDIKETLGEFGFDNTLSSGCSLCPIFCVANWEKKDPNVSLRSIRYAKRLGIDFPKGQQTELREFCTGLT